MSSAADDLFSSPPSRPQPTAGTRAEATYTAADIEVLEGLEPVRRRPGMYIGGTDERALHHLFAEVIDNAMDEAVAGHATRIEIALEADGCLSVADNGRGIPIDAHAKYKNKSALEVIMTTLHSGGKFDSKVYETSGGLHGVGISVVNALSEFLRVEVARGKKLYAQEYAHGAPQTPLECLGDIANRRGTLVKFRPDREIFDKAARFRPRRLYEMARSKAYLFAGVEIRWRCAPEILNEDERELEVANFRFPEGLRDYLRFEMQGRAPLIDDMFGGEKGEKGRHGSVEWALCWHEGEAFGRSYCNTVPTPQGGTHEQGLRNALIRAVRQYGDLSGLKKAALITPEDMMGETTWMLSVFIREPRFSGQTKERLTSEAAIRLVETAVRDSFDHWLADAPTRANALCELLIERAEERLRRRQQKDINRKSATRRLRLPGKLADCSSDAAVDTELFIVEGDSAGGSAKQARDRAKQAVLPLRGKILNVASAGRDKIAKNQQLADLLLALGCGTGKHYREEALRYEKIIIMTDADVDGAHIASLLITFFYQEIPQLIENGHLYLAVPPLYRLTQGAKTLYARDDAHKAELLEGTFSGKGKVEIGRFKGLGEMLPRQLKETTMHPESRTLLNVRDLEADAGITKDAIERLMGVSAEARFKFIQENAAFAQNLDV